MQHLAHGSDDDGKAAADVHWVFRLVPILTGYGVLALIGYLFIQWVQRRVKENDHNFRHNCCFNFIRLFAVGRPEYRLGNGVVEFTELEQNENGLKEAKTHEGKQRRKLPRRRSGFLEDFFYLSIYFLGIQVCLVCMGFFQERIMTRGYLPRGPPMVVAGQPPREPNFFRDAQFLVFANRMVALFLSGAYLLFSWKRQPVHVPPLYLHSFASFSNVISSWCQYEALKYVSFPTQTVCKASKIVPTMLMGKFIRRQRYTANEYLLAFILVIGASMFFLAMSTPVEEQQKVVGLQSVHANDWMAHLQNHSDTISGLVLMCGYLLFDAFTPNWQKKLFDQPPRISTSQMMFAVNAFSVLLCLISLVHQWTLVASMQFILGHEGILMDCLLLSMGSAFGQVFIYMTIKRFGPVVLSILMTIRQIISIILSSIYFVHPISLQGLTGLILVFSAIFFDIYSKYRIRRRQHDI